MKQGSRGTQVLDGSSLQTRSSVAFDKHYPNRKDIRKPYRKSKRFDRSCRNHGSCGYSQNNRELNDRRRELAASDSEREDGE